MGVEGNGHWQLEKDLEVYLLVEDSNEWMGKIKERLSVGLAAQRVSLLAKIGHGTCRS